MREVKKVTLSAILCALAVAIMALGAVVETVDMTMAALASLTAVLVYAEIGSPYTYLTWIVSSLLTALLFPQSLLWAEYLLIFGVYPFLKGYIERLPRLLWLPIKLVYFNAALFGMLLIMQVFYGMPLFGEGADPSFLIDLPFLEGHASLALFLLWLIANAALLAYDLFLKVVLRIWCLKYRQKLSRFFK